VNISSDGFSYHTMLVKKLLSCNEYKVIKNSLYEAIKTERCKVFHEGSCIISDQYKEEGIIIRLKKNINKFSYLELRINPLFLIGEGDYSRIFSFSADNVYRASDKIDEVLKCLGMDFNFEDMKLSRIDLCVNFEVPDEATADAYMRIFKKCKLPYSYMLVPPFGKDEKNYIEMNRNSFRASNQSSTLTIYNKTFQLQNEELIDNELIPIILIRVEVELKRKEINEIIQCNSSDILLLSNRDLLIFMGENSKLILTEYLKQFFLPGRYLSFDEAKKVVAQSENKKGIKRRMLYLLEKASERKNLSIALKKLEGEYCLTKYQLNKILEKFTELRINPITLLNSQSLIKNLQSIYEVLDMEYN